jgi:hypothetical protein
LNAAGERQRGDRERGSESNQQGASNREHGGDLDEDG